MKDALVKSATLTVIDPHAQYYLYTDASNYCVGATLTQEKPDGTLTPVAFMSKKMLDAETRYPTREQELLAILIACKK